MLSLVSDADILKLQELHPNTYIDPYELECNLVYNSPQRNLNIPAVFIEHIFPIMYGVKLSDVTFKDNDSSNWNYDNIIFKG